MGSGKRAIDAGRGTPGLPSGRRAWLLVQSVYQVALRPAVVATIIAAMCLAFLSYSFVFAAAPQAQQIRIEYGQPKNPALEPVYSKLKQEHVLEYVRDVLSVFKLPRTLTIRLADCNGLSNAAYGNDSVIVCYEYVADILKNASEKQLPIGISRMDTIVGPLVDVFLHEGGHAIFAYLHVPLFGNEEDAADQFSSFIMLQFDKKQARRLILGSAYQYRMDVSAAKRTIATSAFADVHGQPAQRYFNVLCMAYGADPELFADLVTKAYLPKDRAKYCSDEYRRVSFAFKTLIGPHIDQRLAREALERPIRQ
jgi:Putative metallopeptidase